MDPQVVIDATAYLSRVQRGLDEPTFCDFVESLRAYKYKRQTRRQTLLKLQTLLRPHPALLDELERDWNNQS